MARRYIHWVPTVPVMKRIGRFHTTAYRATRGLVGARADGLDMLLLTTRGRRTGLERTSPLPYFQDGPDLVLIASFGGNPSNPAWLLNLEAEPKAGVQVRGRKGLFEGRVAAGELRARLWDEITAEHPRYREYQIRTDREIPMVVLEGARSLLA